MDSTVSGGKIPSIFQRAVALLASWEKKPGYVLLTGISLPLAFAAGFVYLITPVVWEDYYDGSDINGMVELLCVVYVLIVVFSFPIEIDAILPSDIRASNLRKLQKYLLGFLTAIAVLLTVGGVLPLQGGKRLANEPAAVTTLRQYASAQGTYHRQDYDGDGVLEYASSFTQLFDWDGPGGTEPIRLVDLATAKAEMKVVDSRGNDGKNGYGGESAPRSGYYFAVVPKKGKDKPECTFDARDKKPLGYSEPPAAIAFPAVYGTTETHTYFVVYDVVPGYWKVYQKKIKGLDAQHPEMIPKYVPDFEKEGWKEVK